MSNEYCFTLPDRKTTKQTNTELVAFHQILQCCLGDICSSISGSNALNISSLSWNSGYIFASKITENFGLVAAREKGFTVNNVSKIVDLDSHENALILRLTNILEVMAIAIIKCGSERVVHVFLSDYVNGLNIASKCVLECSNSADNVMFEFIPFEQSDYETVVSSYPSNGKFFLITRR